MSVVVDVEVVRLTASLPVVVFFELPLSEVFVDFVLAELPVYVPSDEAFFVDRVEVIACDGAGAVVAATIVHEKDCCAESEPSLTVALTM